MSQIIHKFKDFLSLNYKKRPILFPLGVLTCSFFLYISIILSPKFQSEIILEIASDSPTSSSLQIDLFSGPSFGSSNDLFKLKTYLESKSASLQFEKIIDTNQYFQKARLDPYSRYFSSITSFHDYFNSKVMIVEVETDSQTLKIISNAFNPKEALEVNLALLLVVDQFFQDQIKLNSEIKKRNKECEIGIIQRALLTGESGYIPKKPSSVPIEDFASGNDLLNYLAKKAAEVCQQENDKSNNNYNFDVSNISLPENILRELNYSSLKDAIARYYQDNLNLLRNSNYISIISEPQIPTEPVNKDILFNTFLFGAVSFLILLSIRVFLRLRRDFDEL